MFQLIQNHCALFQVPFDEDDKDKSVWFLDHDYLENMYGMFKKVNGKYISNREANLCSPSWILYLCYFF